MPSAALRPAQAVAQVLRRHRRQAGLSLRQVSALIGEQGERLPPSTLARIEQGKLEPGARRLHLLLRLYRIPADLVSDLVEIESRGIEIPDHGDLNRLMDDSLEHWNAGNTYECLAHLLAVLQYTPRDENEKLARQRAMIAIATRARNWSRIGLARKIVDELLCEPPLPEVLVRSFTLAADLWHSTGATEVGLALANHASTHIKPGDHLGYGMVFHQKALMCLDSGRIDQAHEELRNALRHYRSVEYRIGETRGLILRVRLELSRGNPTAAIRAGRTAASLVRDHGLGALAASANIQWGWALTEGGRYDDAETALIEGLSAAIRTDNRSHQFAAHHRLWKLNEARGDRARARLALQQARLFAVEIDDPMDDAAREVLAQAD